MSTRRCFFIGLNAAFLVVALHVPSRAAEPGDEEMVQEIPKLQDVDLRFTSHRDAAVVLRQNERAWFVGSGSNLYGLVQFSDRTTGSEPFVRRTSVHFGSHFFTVRRSAMAVAIIGIIMVCSLGVVGFIIVRSFRQTE
jgi:hypothetical protein